MKHSWKRRKEEDQQLPLLTFKSIPITADTGLKLHRSDSGAKVNLFLFAHGAKPIFVVRKIPIVSLLFTRGERKVS